MKDREKFKEMTRKQIVEYIWDYYKLQIVFGAFFILLMGIFISEKINATDYLLDVTFQGGYVDSKKVDELGNKALMAIVPVPKKNQSILMDFMALTKQTDGTETLDPNVQQKFVVQIAAKAIDVLVTTKSNFDIYAKQGIYKKLDNVKSIDLSKYKSEKATVTSENGTEGIYGIDIENSKFLKAAGFNTTNKVIGIVVNSTNELLSEKFVNWILNN